MKEFREGTLPSKTEIPEIVAELTREIAALKEEILGLHIDIADMETKE